MEQGEKRKQGNPWPIQDRAADTIAQNIVLVIMGITIIGFLGLLVSWFAG